MTRTSDAQPLADTNDKTLWQLAANACGGSTGALVGGSALMLALFLGTNIVWGLTGEPDQTLISSWMSGIAPLSIWATAHGTALIAASVALALRGRKAWLTLVAMITANLVGVAISKIVQGAVSIEASLPMETPGAAVGVLAYRSFFLIPILPMLLVAIASGRFRSDYPLRVGRWGVRTLLFRRNAESTWSRITGWFGLLFFLPAFLLFQAGVGFEPVKSGAILLMAAPVLLLALFNALAEEVVFRGLLLPPLAASIGPAAAIWVQGAAFGLLHWGASPDAIAGLPMALGIGFFSVIGAKATLEMRGLGFTTAGHMMADVAIFSAHFI